MAPIAYVVLFSILGSIVSLAGGIALLLSGRTGRRETEVLAAFAAGALLAAAFTDLLPEAVAHEGPMHVVPWALGGFLTFLVLERAVSLYHARDTCDEHREHRATSALVIIGDTMHNLIDGVVIGGTFVAGVPVGIVTSLSIAAHEIPQEIGDFAILLHNGMRRGRVLLVNLISASVTIVGALLTWWNAKYLIPILPHFLAVTAGLFVYIAAVDLIPELHQEGMGSRRTWINTAALVIGAGTIVVFVRIFGV